MAGTVGSPKKVVIDFSIMSQDAVRNIQALNKELDALKVRQLQLKAAKQQDSEEYIKNQAAIKAYTQALKANERELDNNIKAQQEDASSLNAMRAQLRTLISTYSDLSKEEREAAKGEELLKQIDEQTKAVSKLEHKMGDFGRQVGNYSSIWNNMPGPIAKVKKGFDELSGGTGKLSVALKNGATAVGSFAKQLLKLMANPIVALFAAIAVAVKKVTDAFRENDRAMTELQSLFAAFKPIADVLNGAFSAIADSVGKVIGKVSQLVQSLMSAIPAFRVFSKAEEDLVREKDALEDADREYAENHAKRMQQAQILWNQTYEKDKYSVEERQEFLRQYNQIMEEDAKEAEDIAQRKLRVKEREITLQRGWYKTQNKLTKEQYDALNDADKEYYTSLIQSRAKYEKQVQNADGKLKDWQVQNAKARLGDVNRELQQYLKVGLNFDELTKDQLDQISDAEKNSLTQLRVAVTDAQTAYYAETQASTKRLQQFLNEQEAETIKGINEVTKANDEAAKKASEDTKKAAEDAKILAQVLEEVYSVGVNAEADIYEKERIRIEEYYDSLLNKVRELHKQGILSAEELSKAEYAINERRQSEINKVTQNELDDIDKLKKAINDINLKPIEFTDEQQLENLKTLKQELEQLYNDAMAAVDENGTVEQYQKLLEVKQQLLQVNEQISAQEDLIRQKEQKNVQQRIDDTTSVLASMQQVVNGLGGVFSELAQTNEKFAKYSKALAITEAVIAGVIASVQAIATATRSSATWVDMLVAVATVTATVASIVGTAIAQLQQTKVQSAPKFWTGGPVDKGQSGKDKVPAMLTKGEYVISKPVVDKVGLDFLNSLNFGKLRVPFNTTGHYAVGGMVQGSVDMDYSQMKDVMKEAFTESLEAMPVPILDVREVTNVQNRVKIKEQLSRQ